MSVLYELLIFTGAAFAYKNPELLFKVIEYSTRKGKNSNSHWIVAGDLASLAERLPSMDEALGSIPSTEGIGPVTQNSNPSTEIIQTTLGYIVSASELYRSRTQNKQQNSKQTQTKSEMEKKRLKGSEARATVGAELVTE